MSERWLSKYRLGDKTLLAATLTNLNKHGMMCKVQIIQSI